LRYNPHERLVDSEVFPRMLQDIRNRSTRKGMIGCIVGTYILSRNGVGIPLTAYSTVDVFPALVLDHGGSVAGAQRSGLGKSTRKTGPKIRF